VSENLNTSKTKTKTYINAKIVTNNERPHKNKK
jgi:hypothetical protein